MSLEALPLLSISAFDWVFCEGTPRENWQYSRQAGKAFALDACINLDELCCQPPIAQQSEGVLYATIKLDQDTNAILGIGCNWCFEAYCDGKLLKSTYQTGNGESYVFPANHRINFLVTKGEHLLAIRVKRGLDSWHFACGYCSVQAPPEPELSQGPWLTNPDVGMMTVNFTCKTELGCAVQYRAQGAEDWQTNWHQRQGQCLRRTFHSIKLSGLKPGESYEYQVIAIHPDKYLPVPISEVMTFQVPDDSSTNFSFFFTADLQFPLDKQREILDRMLAAAEASSCDFFILGGDINSAFMPMEVISGPFAQICDCGDSPKPILYIRGNHEMRGGFGDRFLEYFATNEGTTYDLIRFGDTAFLLLDAWEDKDAHTPGHTYCQWNLDQVFYQQESEWLDKAMADEKWISARRRIVICHGAPYSHHDRYKAITQFTQKLTDKFFAGDSPLFNINMWLTGHVHNYMRSIPGSDEIAAAEQPHTPRKDGRAYRYPVLTVAGPGKHVFQASCFRVDADELGFTVRAWCDKGQLIEHIRYQNDKSCTEIKSLPHYKVPAQ
jgi:hypothetical protein